MRIVFVMRHPQYIRNFEAVLVALAERGHSIHLAFTPLGGSETGGLALAQGLAARFSTITYGDVGERRDSWAELVKLVRGLRDRLRYQHPDYQDCARLTQRATLKVEGLAKTVARLTPRKLSPNWTTRLEGWLKCIEGTFPAADSIRATLQCLAPDAVLVTPMVDLGSRQRDYVKAAQAQGIPTALCVASWDNLTNKGLIQLVPERVIVWNEHQRREAARYHEVSIERVRVTGAQCYDQWFQRKPARSREAFCHRASLPTAGPFVVYLGSSRFIAPQEAGFVRRWIEALRNDRDPALRDVQVIVRPHPGNPQNWSLVDSLGDQRVVVFPRHGQQVHDDDARADYFDTLHYSAGAVGVNTSAMIEAGIAGCVCHTVRADEFHDTQDGTLHFAYLVRDGYVRSADDLPTHFRQLAATLTDPAAGRESLARFLADFVRPQGLALPSTPRVVAAIEELALLPRRRPGTTSWATRAARAGWWPLACTLLVLRWLQPLWGKRPKVHSVAPPGVPAHLGWHWRRANSASGQPTRRAA